MINIMIPEKCPLKFEKRPETNAMQSLMSTEFSTDIEGADIVLAGIPFDLAVTNRSGTRMGPKYMRNTHFWRGVTCEPDLDIRIDNDLKIVDCGDFELQMGYLPDGFEKITQQTKRILDAGAVPVIVGGDHSISFPELKAYYLTYGPMALIHFDSHLDTSPNSHPTKQIYTHGSPFSNAIREGYIDGNHVIQLGIRGGFRNRDEQAEYSKKTGREFILARDLHYMSYDEIGEVIRKKVGNMPVFVTFDIDFLDPAYAPGTGTPVVGGFSVHDAIMMLEAALPGLDVKGADLVEVMPYYDYGEVTLNSAQTILQKMVTLIAQNLIIKK